MWRQLDTSERLHRKRRFGPGQNIVAASGVIGWRIDLRAARLTVAFTRMIQKRKLGSLARCGNAHRWWNDLGSAFLDANQLSRSPISELVTQWACANMV